MEPGVYAFGRGVTMEIDFAQALGIDYRETPAADDDEAWRVVREEVLAGRPTMLSGDIFYLDYREFRAHFPGHRFVLVGFDDEREQAFIADRTDAEPQTCSLGALRKSRNAPVGLSSYNLWGKFHAPEPTRSLADAFVIALRRAAARMTGRDRFTTDLVTMLSGGRVVARSGLDGLARYAEHIEEWPSRPDGATIAYYAGQCIEKFGTGGGNFRVMYAAFLREAARVVPDVADDVLAEGAERSAALWTTLSTLLAERDAPDLAGRCAKGASILREILDVESRLFEAMSERTGA
jgi:hypothetical protein